MRIHQNFIGGNIRVLSIDQDTVTLENELRDTALDWFYFAFCVEGAGGRTLTFRMQKNRLGYFGPAVSHDLFGWRWLGSCEGDTFTYHFAPDENKVYFAHDMLYHPDRFLSFAKGRFAPWELCKSKKGRSVPAVTFGEGERYIILTARHHACESTGSYVLEGVLSELYEHPIENVSFLCVPFMDYDGVVDGDQGKSRVPHDHNRDYDPASPPIYESVKAVRAFAEVHPPTLAFDFHSPWHKGGENDTVFIVQNSEERLGRFRRFSALLESALTPDAMHYEGKNDYPPNTLWNRAGTQFSCYMSAYPTCELAFTLEVTYFGTAKNQVSTERLIALGRCFANAVRTYLSQENE